MFTNRLERAFPIVAAILVACSIWYSNPRDASAEVTIRISDLTEFDLATPDTDMKQATADCCCVASCDCVALQHTHARAGTPQRVAWWAIPSIDHRYIGYYVGGGAAVRGEGRCPQDGVWGVDYLGSLIKRRVNLGWWHGRRYQGGTGAYATEGPHVIKAIKEH